MSAAALPKDWSCRRLRFDARLNPVKSELVLEDDAEVSFVPMDAVGELGGLRLDEQRSVDDVYNGYTYFCDGDIVIAKITPCFENGKGAIAAGLTNGVGFGTTELHVVRPNERLNGCFLFYVTIAHDFRSFGESEMLGAGGQKRVPERFLKDLQLPFPTLETQKRIATFLDEKTAQIDALIEKKQALLERLSEKRQAIITQAVTKGLNPAVPMKDSGIDWLGEVPGHWEKGNIRRFATMKTGHTPSRTIPEYWDNCTIPWFTLSDVWQLRDGTRIYIEETAEKISALGLANSAAELLPTGTVIFSRTASIGFSGIMPCPMATTQDFWNWICGPKLRSEYLLFLFRAMTQKFAEITNGSTHKTIYQPIAAGLEICVPPLAEQNVISSEIQKSMKLVDYARSKVMASITRLTEYRSALITAAVTGQIEGLR